MTKYVEIYRPTDEWLLDHRDDFFLADDHVEEALAELDDPLTSECFARTVLAVRFDDSIFRPGDVIATAGILSDKIFLRRVTG